MFCAGAPACQSQGEEFICTTADDNSTTATCDLDRCPLQGESEAPEMKPQATGWSMSSDLDLMDFLSLKCGVHSKRKYAIFFSSQRRIMIFVTKMQNVCRNRHNYHPRYSNASNIF